LKYAYVSTHLRIYNSIATNNKVPSRLTVDKNAKSKEGQVYLVTF